MALGQVAGAALAVCVVAGCQMFGDDDEEEPAVVKVKLVTSKDVNKNPDETEGTGYPIFVRVYDLKANDKFSTVDFFKLYDDDVQVLGDHLISRKDLVLKPGQRVKLDKRSLSLDAHYIGVMAVYQSIGRDGVVWRASKEVPLDETTELTVKIGAQTVEMAIEDE